MKALRVGLLCSTPMPPEEGISTYVSRLATHLQERGHEPVVLTRGLGLRPRRLQVDGLEAWGLPYLPLHPWHVRAQEALCRGLWRQWRLDLVHAHTPYPPRPPRELPLVATVHTPMRVDAARIPERSPRAALQRAQSGVVAPHERALLEQAQVVTAIAQHVAADLPQIGYRGPVRVLANAVDEAEFRRSATPALSGRPFVLYAGRLGFRKGLPTLMRAFARLEAREAELVLTGRGELGSRLRALAAELGIADRVHFLGVVPRDELLRLYRSAGAVALPSTYEGQPTVLLEAMASGAPVVASRIPGVEELVEDGVTGRLVPPEDEEALAETLHDVLAQPRAARSMGNAARRRVLATHTWEVRAKEYLATYEEALKAHG